MFLQPFRDSGDGARHVGVCLFFGVLSICGCGEVVGERPCNVGVGLDDSWAKVLVAIDDEDVLAEGKGLEGELLEGEEIVLLAAFLSEESSEGNQEGVEAG